MVSEKGQSTIDHVFILKTLIVLNLNTRKRIYCCFIEYQKAFDNVSLLSLWTKKLSLNINGQILNVIKNLYTNAKFCVKMNGKLSNVLKSVIGVRQGDYLSHLLLSIDLWDLETWESFLSAKYGGLTYISELTEKDDDLCEYIKMYIISHADDTVILAESTTELQMSLDAMQSYCNIWKLIINTRKTKIVIISRGKVRRYPKFNSRNSVIDVIDNFTYLGIVFNYNGKFGNAIKHILIKPVELCFQFKKS